MVNTSVMREERGYNERKANILAMSYRIGIKEEDKTCGFQRANKGGESERSEVVLSPKEKARMNLNNVIGGKSRTKCDGSVERGQMIA